MTKPTIPTPCCSWTFDGTTPGCGMAVLAGRQSGMGEGKGQGGLKLHACHLAYWETPLLLVALWCSHSFSGPMVG